MGSIKLKIIIQKDADADCYVGYVPGVVGAHSQGETIEELKNNLKESIALCLEEGDPFIECEYIGVDELEIQC